MIVTHAQKLRNLAKWLDDGNSDPSAPMAFLREVADVLEHETQVADVGRAFMRHALQVAIKEDPPCWSEDQYANLVVNHIEDGLGIEHRKIRLAMEPKP